ncbi:MAG: thioesterase family protein [Sphingomonadaceae bacterium]|nr:thioesterase family protein [Sphingomonadaceae bacterium]
MKSQRPSFYRRDGNSFVPTGLGISPWNGTSQVGMALAGLAGHVLDGVPTTQPMMTIRISIDILGTVPLEPLVPEIRILRDGRRMQVVDAEFRSGDRLWLRATAVRACHTDSSEQLVPATRRFWEESDPHYEHNWFEERHIDLDRTRAGPGAIWTRFTANIVEGEPMVPLAVVAMLGDFGNGTAPLVSMTEATLANLDITVCTSRMPRGEWMLIDADSETAGLGLGYSRSRIGDQHGMFATALQSIFIGPRTASTNVSV